MVQEVSVCDFHQFQGQMSMELDARTRQNGGENGIAQASKRANREVEGGMGTPENTGRNRSNPRGLAIA